MDTGKFTNSECSCKKKKENKPTHGYLVFGLLVKGDMLIYWLEYKEEEKVLFVSGLLTVITVITGIIMHVYVFLKGTQPYTRFFDNNGFLIRRDTNSDFSLTEC